MADEQKDRGLDTPSESNRDKHINFLAEEQDGSDPDNDKGRLYDRNAVPDEAKWQTEEEHEKDKSIDPQGQDKSLQISPENREGDSNLADRLNSSDNSGKSEQSSQQNKTTTSGLEGNK